VKYTGLQDEHNAEEPGQATVYLIATHDEIFDPWMPIPPVNILITAEIEGFDVGCDPGFVFVTRSE